jgi:hypothetical protein
MQFDHTHSVMQITNNVINKISHNGERGHHYETNQYRNY